MNIQMADRSQFVGGAVLATVVVSAFARAWTAPSPSVPERQQVAAAAAAATAAAKAATAAAEGKGKSDTTPDPAQRFGSACDLLRRYYGGYPRTPPSRRCPQFPRVRATAMIAILPDPMDSHLDWLFDAGLESIRRAYERRGFVMDRFWLPWTADADSAVAAGGHLRREANARRQYPGVMLFRHGTRVDFDTLGIVFIVGETPTQGIHKTAFAEALRERDSLAQPAPAESREKCGVPAENSLKSAPDSDEVRIVGPIFSGSSVSLRRSLDIWLCGHVERRVHIVTGGATARSNEAILVDSSAGKITFVATVNPVDLVLAAVTKAVQKMDIKPREVAYLRESTTQFGQAAETRTKTDTVPAKIRAWQDTVQLNTPLEIPFPLSVSRLRAEYARLPQVATPPVPGQPVAPLVPLDLADPSSVTETPPVTSDLTAPMVELTIDNIVQTLALHKIKAVVIIATDVRDRIFLASQVKRRLRDLTVVVVGSNSLYLRPELGDELRGTIVAASYPLILETQFWDLSQSRDRQRFVFSSDLAEGTYNATLLQLGDSADMVDYGFPMRADSVSRPPVWITTVGRSSFSPLTAYRAVADTFVYPAEENVNLLLDKHATHPYVYLRSLPPSAFRKTSEPASYVRELGSRKSQFSVELENAGNLLMIVVISCLVLYVFLSRGKSWDAALKHHGAPLPDPPIVDGKPFGSPKYWREWRGRLLLDRESWIVFRFAAFFGALGPFGLIIFQSRIHGRPPSWLVSFQALLLALASLGVLIFVFRRCRKNVREIREKGPPTDRATNMRYQALVGVSLLYLLATTIFLGFGWSNRSGLAGMFFLHALELGSGVSPIMPLLLGGLTIISACYFHLCRVRLLGHMSAFEAAWNGDGMGNVPRQETLGPSIAATRDPTAELRCSVAEVRDWLTKLAPGHTGLLLLGALGAFGLWLYVKLDGSPEVLILPCSVGDSIGLPDCDVVSGFDMLFPFLIIASIALLAWDLLRFWRVWRALRTCLEYVSLSPVFSAIRQLPPAVARLTRMSALSASDRFVSLTLDGEAHSRWEQLNSMNIGLETRGRTARGPARLPALRSADCEFDLNRAKEFLAVYTLAEKLPRASDAPNERDWQQVLRELAALYIVDYVEWVMRHLRFLALFLLSGLFLTILFLTSYPLEPESLINVSFVALMGGIILALVTVLIQMNKDATLRAIAQSDAAAGTFNARLVVNLILVVGIPTLALISAAFPQVRSFLFSWIAPVLEALSKS